MTAPVAYGWERALMRFKKLYGKNFNSVTDRPTKNGALLRWVSAWALHHYHSVSVTHTIRNQNDLVEGAFADVFLEKCAWSGKQAS